VKTDVHNRFHLNATLRSHRSLAKSFAPNSLIPIALK
jgi:hypothetical protein